MTIHTAFGKVERVEMSADLVPRPDMDFDEAVQRAKDLGNTIVAVFPDQRIIRIAYVSEVPT